MAATITSIDGRTARSERTHATVIEAFLDLLYEGDPRPSTERVAKRAGVSERTVFQHFRDREALYGAVAALQAERIGRLWRELPTTGPFEDRLEAFLEQRARLLETITSVRRAGMISEPFSEVIAAGLADIRSAKAAEVESVFSNEIGALPPGERDEVRAAAVVAASWQSWEGLRAHQGLSVARARAAMGRTLGALLSPR
jgi:TetR/AcrR family transcriptional regulator of autoinduction and epiphytic fitness